MAYEVAWLETDQIYLSRFYGDVSIQDIIDAGQASADLIATSDTPMLHNLVDLSEMDDFPKNLPVLSKALGEVSIDPDILERVGWMVIAPVTNPLISFLVSSLIQMTNGRFRIFDNLDDARAFAYEVAGGKNIASE